MNEHASQLTNADSVAERHPVAFGLALAFGIFAGRVVADAAEGTLGYAGALAAAVVAAVGVAALVMAAARRLAGSP